ncbi:GC-rich sequence DNA-binding factor-like protein-domain-containing protein [Sporodiniella umbellata]|nr:GC-rich sequence DNA-binding factor-like protein-domain-containing protein [Sporodiniella umbellata]
MLEKFGWKSGQGLGAEGEGIVNPIETKLRPSGMGLGFKGFDERTQQAKADAKIQKNDSDDSLEEQPKKREAWKSSHQSKKRKPKTVYKTASEIVAESLPTQKILDYTGPQAREINASDIHETPTMIETTTRLPELRHNLKLIVDLARSDLENLSREKQKNSFELKSIRDELEKINADTEEESLRLEKVKRVKEIALDLERMGKDALGTGAYETGNITALFGEKFDSIEKDFLGDIKSLSLDALVVSVWAPVMKYKSMHWNLLEEPTWGLLDIKRWKKLLPSNDDDAAEWGWTRRETSERLLLTPYEAMIHTVWLSKVRSTINNQWDVHSPEPLIVLLEEWEPVLPRFIFENVINQLLLPKLQRAVEAWNPKTDKVMIHTWIHPWIPLLKLWRLSELSTLIRQKLSVVLRQWHPSDESALHIILPWKAVWTSPQTEQFVIKSILPKLAMTLREEFEVNPRDQHLDSLIWCLSWKEMISNTLMGQLLQHEFFEKWKSVLYEWLALDLSQINFDEIADWYLWWRKEFDSYGLNTNSLIMNEFKNGLDLMNKALLDKKI